MLSGVPEIIVLVIKPLINSGDFLCLSSGSPSFRRRTEKVRMFVRKDDRGGDACVAGGFQRGISMITPSNLSKATSEGSESLLRSIA